MALSQSVLGLGKAESTSNTKQPTQETSSEQPIPLPTVSGPSYSSLVDQRACAPSQNPSQDSLCIEWRAARAAEDQAFWTAATFVVGALGTLFVLWNLYYARRTVEAAQASAAAAEAAAQASVESLNHARDVSERDLRPWLTVDAILTSQVGKRYARLGEGDELSFFIELNCVNIGKVAATNIRYVVDAVDESTTGTQEVNSWFDTLIERTTKQASEESGYYYFGALAPSEKYTNKVWCRVPRAAKGSMSDQIPPEHRTYQIRIVIVVAYKAAGGSKIFHAAKLLPLGRPILPVFHDLLAAWELPIGVDDCCIGPAIKAQTN